MVRLMGAVSSLYSALVQRGDEYLKTTLNCFSYG
jgi:hypothetical protein